jgi:hypothetical protein
MRRLTLGLALGALFAFGLAGTAQAATSTESTWNATATGSAGGGSKSAPAPFSGSWTLTATNNVNPAFRPATPSSWTWSWEGVKVNQKGVPSCTTDQVNDAKSVAGCPAGSHIGIGPVPGAIFGNAADAAGPNTFCGGKTFDLYNGKPGELTLVLDGPPEQCGTLGFLGALPVTLATSGGKTTMTWPVPENIQHPLPGADGALLGGTMVFNNLKAKVKPPKGKRKKALRKCRKIGNPKKQRNCRKRANRRQKVSLFNSINCKGARAFQMAVVDTFGTHQINMNAGSCKKPKKKKEGRKKHKK